MFNEGILWEKTDNVYLQYLITLHPGSHPIAEWCFVIFMINEMASLNPLNKMCVCTYIFIQLKTLICLIYIYMICQKKNCPLCVYACMYVCMYVICINCFEEHLDRNPTLKHTEFGHFLACMYACMYVCMYQFV